MQTSLYLTRRYGSHLNGDIDAFTAYNQRIKN
jgi:hypothetical protein